MIGNSEIRYINNKILIKLDLKDLINMDIVILDNETINEDEIDNFLNCYIDFYKKYGDLNISEIFTLFFYKDMDQYYLIKNKQNYYILKKFYNKYFINLLINVEIINIVSYDQLKDHYKLINNGKFLTMDHINTNMIDRCANYFLNKYPNVWSENSKARRPFIFFIFFKESLSYLSKILNIFDYKILKNYIEEYNNDLSKWDIENFPNINQKMLNKCKEFNFYLGLFPYTDLYEECNYEWVKNIIQLKSGKCILKKSIYKKKKIPKKIKMDTWNRFIGNDKGKTLCISCNNTYIFQGDFEAGHIISEKNGGKPCIDNILPICSLCNKSMGSWNMDDFINTYYPNNINNFRLKNYNNRNNFLNNKIINFKL